MKLLISILFILFLSSCGATQYRYQTESNSMQWKGKNIQDVRKQWGEASDTMHTRSGVSYYVYLTNDTANFFRSTVTNFDSGDPDMVMGGPVNNAVTLKCTTVFTTDKNGTITNVTHRGSNCGGEWVPKKKG